MTNSKPEQLKEIALELEKVDSLILAATRLVNDGRVIDLGALQDRTAALCDAALALPVPQSKSLLEPMTDLIDHLDRLTLSLNEKYGDLPEFKSEAQPGAAASAYARGLDSEG